MTRPLFTLLLLTTLPTWAQAEGIYLQQDAQELRLSNLPPSSADAAADGYQLVAGDAVDARAALASRPAHRSLPYAAAVASAASQHRVEAALLHAIMQVESAGDARAVSPRGARGLMQLMPATARQFAVQDVLDPQQNVQGAARYLRALSLRFGGDLKLMLAAYNAGPQAVIRHGNQVPPYAETQRYVPRVLQRYRQLAAEAAD